MSDCIFCKIINGEIPSKKVFENEHILAFMDVAPVTKGHTLVIPKVHKENVYELSEEQAANLYKEVPKIANAIKKAFNPIGLNTVNNNGEAAGQTVFHYHMHLVPRYGEGDGFGAVWKAQKTSPEELTQFAEEIEKNL